MYTRRKKHNTRSFTAGFLLLNTIVFAAIGITITYAFIGWATTSLRGTRHIIEREQAFQVAEAGIEYYRWHLAHAPADYKDGTNTNGPYAHSFTDKDGSTIGSFSLTITPPLAGSTVVTIQSQGSITANPSVHRTIRSKLAIPSFAKFAVVANDNIRFGSGTVIDGPVHSNKGIRFDGLAKNIVSSFLNNYDDPDHSGNNEYAVHTHVNAPPSSGINDTFRALEAPPVALPSRSDVFVAGRQLSVPQADFAGITTDLSAMKTSAQASGKYLGPSGALGYHIIFKINDTFDVYKVTNMQAAGNGCTNSQSQTGWGTWSIKSSNGQTFIANYPNPTNGIIFVEDDAWVDGKINTARVTVAAGKFPDNVNTRKNITVNANLEYTNFDGSDVLALVAQNNINVGMISANDLKMHAALMAQNGRVGRFYYGSSCSNYIRNSLTLYGMIGTNIRYGFAYTDGTGYQTRTITYDANLLYAPPPSFPLAGDKYQTISWEEIE